MTNFLVTVECCVRLPSKLARTCLLWLPWFEGRRCQVWRRRRLLLVRKSNLLRASLVLQASLRLPSQPVEGWALHHQSTRVRSLLSLLIRKLLMVESVSELGLEPEPGWVVMIHEVFNR